MGNFLKKTKIMNFSQMDTIYKNLNKLKLYEKLPMSYNYE